MDKQQFNIGQIVGKDGLAYFVASYFPTSESYFCIRLPDMEYSAYFMGFELEGTESTVEEYLDKVYYKNETMSTAELVYVHSSHFNSSRYVGGEVRIVRRKDNMDFGVYITNSIYLTPCRVSTFETSSMKGIMINLSEPTSGVITLESLKRNDHQEALRRRIALIEDYESSSSTEKTTARKGTRRAGRPSKKSQTRA